MCVSLPSVGDVCTTPGQASCAVSLMLVLVLVLVLVMLVAVLVPVVVSSSFVCLWLLESFTVLHPRGVNITMDASDCSPLHCCGSPIHSPL